MNKVPLKGRNRFMSVVISFLSFFIRGGTISLIFLFSPTYLKALIILRIPCQIQLQLCLSFLDRIPTHVVSIPILSPGYTSLVLLPGHFLLALLFDQEVATQPCRSPAFLA